MSGAQLKYWPIINVLEEKFIATIKKVLVYGELADKALMLLEDDSVFTIGRSRGRPLSSEKSFNAICLPTKERELSNKGIVDFVYSDAWGIIALTDKGKVSWGHGPVHSANASARIEKIEKLLENTVITQIACGHCHFTALSDSGEVWAWAKGNNGVLYRRYEPSVLNIACGYYSSTAVTTNGQVFVWDDRDLGASQNSMTPTYENCVTKCDKNILVGLKGFAIVKVACGYSHTMAMTDTGDLYVWGENSYGQLGLNTMSVNISKPVQATSDLTIKIEGKFIHVHKFLLRIRSEYFHSMFAEHWAKNNQSTIEHDDFCYDVYKSFLKYLYTDEVDARGDTLLELFSLSNVYCHPQLKRRCIQLLRAETQVSNVLHLYDLSVTYETKELENFCLDFATNHMHLVVQSPYFSKLSGERAKELFTKVAMRGAFKPRDGQPSKKQKRSP